MPTVEYLEMSSDSLCLQVNSDVQHQRNQRHGLLRNRIHDDIDKAGTRAYQQIRDAGVASLTHLSKTNRFQLQTVRWSKTGRSMVYAVEPSAL